MCKYCGKGEDNDVIKDSGFVNCRLEVFIDQYGHLTFNTYKHETEFTEDIVEDFKINFCPMCGSKL